MNKEQKTKNEEQRTKNKEKRTKNKEQRTRNEEQRTKNKEQKTITIPDHGKNDELEHFLVNSILKQAGLK